MIKENEKLLIELQGESPRGSSLLLFLIIFILSVLFWWAYVTQLDVVIRGQGKIISQGKNQMVQSADAGVIIERFVSVGDTIQTGDILFEIDLIDLKGQIDQINERIILLQIKKDRLNAESGKLEFKPKSYLTGEKLEFAASETQLFISRSEQLISKKRVLESRRDQRKSEIGKLFTEEEYLLRNLKLIISEIEAVEPLVEANLAPETRLIKLQRDKADTSGRLSGIPYSIEQIRGSIIEIDEQLAAEDQNFLTQALSELSQVNLEIDELGARLPLLKARLKKSLVRSPIDGIVNRITFESDEAYIKTGDVLLEIVPIGDQLIVEAKIDPKDIAKIAVSNEARVSLTAFDASKFGRIDGEVIKISADALSNAETGEQFYSVQVSLTGGIQSSDGEDLTILPGMVATIEVLSGKRSILDYFWQPLVKGKDKAFRE
jgi:membrane fusion protein, adhesin transport system